MSYTPANLANLTHQLEAANLCERLFSFLRLAELQVAEAVRAHSIAFLRGLCHDVCGDSGSADPLRSREDTAQVPDSSFLYAQIVGAVDTDQHTAELAPLEIRPAKEGVLETLHGVLAQYLSTMDDLPRLVRHPLGMVPV